MSRKMKDANACISSNNGKFVVEQHEDAAAHANDDGGDEGSSNTTMNATGHSSLSQVPSTHTNSSGEATCNSRDVAAMCPHHNASDKATSFHDNEQSSCLPSSTNNNRSNETKTSQNRSKPSCKRRRPSDASTMEQNHNHNSGRSSNPSTNESNNQLNNQKINRSIATSSTNFPNTKRNTHKNDLEQNSTPLTFLCLSKSWIAATKRAQSHPHEAQYGCTSSARSLLPLGSNDENDINNDQTSSNHVFHGNNNNTNAMASSPLALVTRYGAPSDCIEAVLNAEKRMIQRCIPNRGTPLHEAIMLYPTSTCTSSSIATAPSSENGNNNATNDNSNSINDQIQEYVKIVRMLIKADELIHNEDQSDTKNYGNNRKRRKLIKRATLAQDVDGNVPLHLLIRQAFYNYLGGITADTSSPSNKQTQREQETQDVEHPILTVARELIQSSPEAVSIPDCTEFEETPLILALKSSVYANEQHQQQQRFMQNNASEDGIDYYNATLERKIFDMCKIMLQSSPDAASRVMIQNGYTAVHSAVFHGRCSDIIRLLLNADEVNRKWNFKTLKQNGGGDSVKMEIPATMQANKFGELPLHIATMRGECTRSIALLSENAPWAVLRRDVKLGLTPLHWLWVRFMDRIVERFGEEGCTNMDNDDSDEDMKINLNDEEMSDSSEEKNGLGAISFGNHSSFTSTSNTESLHGDLRSGNGHIHFDLEYHIRTEAIDPPVHYTRMRHIVPEYLKLEQKLTNRVIKVLRRVRERHKKMMDKMLLVKRQRDKNQNGPMNSLRLGPMDEHPDSLNDSATKQTKCPHKQMNSSSTNRCPFTGAREEVKEVLCLPDSNLKCPYAHLASNASQKETKCPYSSSSSIPPTHNKIDTNESNKKCPFRCPFVFDSYPLNDEMKGFAGEQSVREEQVISLFWAKVTSLLQAAAMGRIVGIETAMTSPDLMEHIDFGKIFMLHTACSSPCPAAIVKLCLELCHEQLREKDSTGKLPLHHAALREIDPRELSMLSKEKIASINRSASNNVIKSETSRVLDMVLNSSPFDAARTFDLNKRLPLHYMIDSVVSGAVQCSLSMNLGGEGCEKLRRKEAFDAFFIPLKSMINAYPEALETLDEQTQLFPVMQASAAAYESFCKAEAKKRSNKFSLTIVFSLLLEKPSIVSAMKPVK